MFKSQKCFRLGHCVFNDRLRNVCLRRSISSSLNLALKGSQSLQSLNESLLDVTPLPELSWDRGAQTSKDGMTPLYASMRKLIDKNPGAVCLIQVGSFYELYFEQAEKYAPILGLKIASRKTNNNLIPMSGFPVFQIQKFLKTLIQEIGVNVAIIDQYPNAGNLATNLIHRRISRIVTPGTLIDESFLHYHINNYLVSISIPPGSSDQSPDPEMEVGVAWVDLSVGDFYVQQTTLESLSSDIARINPNEIILPHEFYNANIPNGKWFPPLKLLQRYFLRYHKPEYKDLKHLFKDSLQIVRKQFEDYSVREEVAINMILSYIKINLPDLNHSLELPTKYWNSHCVQMDSRTQEALELTGRTTVGRTSTVGSFLATIKRTVTPSGTRRLTQWVKSPILDLAELQKRQTFVKLFTSNDILRTTLREHMSHLGDFIRSVQRLSLGSGESVVHILSIAESLKKLSEIERLLKRETTRTNKDDCISSLVHNFDVPSSLTDKIYKTLAVQSFVTGYGELKVEINANSSDEHIDEDANNYDVQDVNFDKIAYNSDYSFWVLPNYSEELQTLHLDLKRLVSEEFQMINSLKFDIHSIDPKLSIVKKSTHGRLQNVLQISGKQKSIQRVIFEFDHNLYDRRKGSVIFKSQEWDTLQMMMHQKIQEIKIVEKEIIENLRLEILEILPQIRKLNRMVDFLDITSSFSILAEECKLVCPRFVKTNSLNVSNGRHLVVESSLKLQGDMFTPNDTKLGSQGNAWIISGPNMGGKSTFLRQNALIVILAQIGSFVPAEKATLSIVDKIFTRIGASDDLYSDLSTFMVEMIETSNILRKATPRSLAIVDEIGRGTSGKEGLAIAYATLINLLKVNKCRTLFATHYGAELQYLLSRNDVDQSKVRYYRSQALFFEKQNGDNLIVDYRLEPGISDKSYAIEIAIRSGFPKSAINRATKALEILTGN